MKSPYIDHGGSLVIPLDCPRRYRWWQLPRGRTLDDEEGRAHLHACFAEAWTLALFGRDAEEHDAMKRTTNNANNGQRTLFDAAAARAGRDAGIGLVTAHNAAWMERALGATQQLAGSQRCMTGEELRVWLLPQVGRPKHHNAWGAMVRILKLRNLVLRVDHRPMRTPKSHARDTPVWQFL
jgi:hypothetical protein